MNNRANIILGVDQKRATLRGHTWQPPHAMQPALRVAIERWQPARKRELRCIYPYWVLDHTFEYGMRYQVQAVSKGWRTRTPQTLHLYPPGTEYREDESGLHGQMIHNVFILFCGGQLMGLDRMVRPRNDVAFINDPQNRLTRLLQRITTLGHEQRDAGLPAAQAVLWEIATLLQRSRQVGERTFECSDGHDASEDTNELITLVDQYFHQHLADKVTLADLASYTGLSVSSIAHQYRALTGTTPMKALNHLRIQIAKGLLIKGQPLEAIAIQTGFADGFHLSRTFKRFEGITPSQYRQQYTY